MTDRERLLDLEATIGAIQVLMRQARGEGSKVLALEALDQAFGVDEPYVPDPGLTALAESLADTWDRTPPAADIRTPGWQLREAA